MAYRHFNGAPYLQCWSDGSHVCVQELDGRINKYPCALGVCIDPQITPFYGVDAVWCLRHAGLLYVGRNDSTFSGFRETDGVLVRYGPWGYPWGRTFEIVGQWGGYSAVLDFDDMRTVYVHDPKKGYILNKPLSMDILLPLAAGDAVKSMNDLSIYTKGGWLDVGEAGAWIDAPEPPWGSSPLQL